MRLLNLYWISVFFSFPLAAQRYSRTFSHEGKFYHYLFEPSNKAPQWWNFTLSVVQHNRATGQVESNKIYSSDAHISTDGKRLSHVRIYAATPLDYSWAVSYSHFYEAVFHWSTGKIEYAYSGQRMESAFTPYQSSQEISRFNVATATPEELIQIAVAQFVLRYHKLFRYPEAVIDSLTTITGQVTYNHQVYHYQIRRNFFNPGDDNLSIRKPGAGLVFNTLIQTEQTAQELRVKIYYVQQRGLTWSVFANDYLTARFFLKEGQIKWEKTGKDMPSNLNPPTPKTTFPPDASVEELFHLAVEYLVQQYSAAFAR